MDRLTLPADDPQQLTTGVGSGQVFDLRRARPQMSGSVSRTETK
jgi:hypothetical protein